MPLNLFAREAGKEELYGSFFEAGRVDLERKKLEDEILNSREAELRKKKEELLAKQKVYTQKLAEKTNEEMLSRGRARAPMTGLQKGIDLIMRPTYAATRAEVEAADRHLDRKLRGDKANPLTLVGDALASVGEGVKEFFGPKYRMTHKDVIDKYADQPVNKADNLARHVLGLAADIALDPTTYVGLGAAKGAFTAVSSAGSKLTLKKGSAKQLTKLAAKHAEELIKPNIHPGRSKNLFKLGGELGEELSGKLKDSVLDKLESVAGTPVKYSDALKMAETESRRIIDQWATKKGILYLTENNKMLSNLDARASAITKKLYSKKALTAEEIKFAKELPKKKAVLDKALKESVENLNTFVKVVDDSLPRFLQEAGEYTTTKFTGETAVAGRLATDEVWDSISKTLDVTNGVHLTPERIHLLHKLEPAVMESLIEKGGIKFAGTTLVSGKQVSTALHSLGIPQLLAKVGSLPIIKPIVKAAQNEYLRWGSRLSVGFKIKHAGDLANPSNDPVIKKIFKASSKESTDIRLKMADGKIATDVGEAKIAAIEAQAGEAIRLRKKELTEWGVEYMNLRQNLIVGSFRTASQLRKSVMDMFQGAKISPERRKQIGEGLVHLQLAMKQAAKMKDTTFNPGIVLKKAMDNLNLTPQEHGVVTRMFDAFNKMGTLEQEIGILGRMISEGYSPLRWTVAKSTNIREALYRHFITSPYANQAMRQGGDFVTEFTPGQLRKISTIEEAAAKGLEPITDIASLYVLRFMEHQRGMSEEVLLDFVRRMYPNAKRNRFGKIVGVPQAVLDDMALIGGHGVRSKTAMKEGFDLTSYLMFAADNMTNVFRRYATVVKTGFGTRNAISNKIQESLVLGQGAFDPRSQVEAVMLMTNRPDSIKGFRNGLGEYVDGNMLRSEIEEQGIIRGIDVTAAPMSSALSDKKMAEIVTKELNSAQGKASWWRRVAGLDHKEVQGLEKLWRGAINITNWPRAIEDYSRTVMYVNARRLGHDKHAATKLTNQAMFDYLHGLTQWERDYVRRFLIPFYSFQRFALPLVTTVAAKHPGRISNNVKVAKEFLSAWNSMASGQSLTEAERRAIPGFLLEQPHTFERWEDPGLKQVFRTFNNFTPLDVLGLVQSSSEGNDNDTRHMMLKAVASQIAPVIKVPLEMFFNKDFFTGRPLENARNRALTTEGEVDPDKFLSYMMMGIGKGVPGGAVSGAAALGITRIAGGLFPSMSEATLKTFLGWENGVNLEGKPTTYVNSMALHILMSLFPSLNDELKLSRPDRTPMDNVLQYTFGIGTSRRNALSDANWKLKRKLQEFEEIQTQMRDNARRARVDEVDQNLEMLDKITKEYNELQQILSGPRTPQTGAN